MFQAIRHRGRFEGSDVPYTNLQPSNIACSYQSENRSKPDGSKTR